MDSVPLVDATTHAEPLDLPGSEVVRREVYVKETKGKLGVRKLVICKTNKESTDPRFPSFGCHWTDYSHGRKQPPLRVVRLATSADSANQIGDDLIASKIKEGWDAVV